jgi:hypothetical protein
MVDDTLLHLCFPTLPCLSHQKQILGSYDQNDPEGYHSLADAEPSISSMHKELEDGGQGTRENLLVSSSPPCSPPSPKSSAPQSKRQRKFSRLGQQLGLASDAQGSGGLFPGLDSPCLVDHAKVRGVKRRVKRRVGATHTVFL